MDIYGLLGKSLQHSFSPDFFNTKFKNEAINASYLAFELNDIAEIKNIVAQYPKLKGLNVTIPYKESVMEFLDEIDPIAQAIGAVNCIKIEGNKLIGYNTDWWGFKETLLKLPLDKSKQAIILGTGGAAKAVAAAFHALQIEYIHVSRSTTENNASRVISYIELNDIDFTKFQLLVNTTPIGMYPNVEEAPIFPYIKINDTHILYDLIYNPERTKFLEEGKEKNCIIINGYNMLILQAMRSWDIWKMI